MDKTIWAIVVLIVVLAGGWFFLRDGAAPQEEEVAVEPVSYDVELVNHIEANLPEQDVFIESEEDPDMVVRVEGENALDPENMEQMLYAAAEAVEHDPFKLGENPLGPFPKGEALGMTLGDWLSAAGSGTYVESEDSAELALEMTDLVPNGIYTVWCSEIVLPPDVSITDEPCGAADGSENKFVADENGNATYQVTMDPLAPSTDEKLSLVALAYHSDGETYGEEPGDFGLVTHVHIFWVVPAAEAGEEAAGEEAAE